MKEDITITMIPGMPGYGLDENDCLWSFKRKVPRRMNAYNPPPLYALCVNGVMRYKSIGQIKTMINNFNKRGRNDEYSKC